MKTLILSARKVAAGPRRFVCACYRETLRPVRFRILIMGAFLGCAAALFFPTGSASTEQGIAREQTYYRAGTNIVAEARSILYAQAGYVIAGTAWLLPWHLVWKWKAR